MIKNFFFFPNFFFFFFSVGKVVRYNTALARFRDNPGQEKELLSISGCMDFNPVECTKIAPIIESLCSNTFKH